MLKKKFIVLGAIMTFTAMTLVGCGNADNNNSVTSGVTQSPDTDNVTTDMPAASADGNENGGVVDDLENGAEDAIDGVGDAVDDAVDDLDGANDTTENPDGNTDQNTDRNTNKNTDKNKNTNKNTKKDAKKGTAASPAR